MDNSLEFDEITMDISLAEDFLMNQPEFKPIGYTASEIGYNKCKNNIFYNLTNSKINREFKPTNKEIEVLKPMLLQLAFKIEKNIDLFSQLEYLIRKNPPKNVKEIDLRLIIQNLKYYATSSEYISVPTNEIIMDDDTPLVILGYIPQVLLSRRGTNTVIIKSTIESAVVCWLFTKLCHDVGLNGEVFLNIMDKTGPTNASHQVDLLGVPELSSGCLGVMAARCDVDSAVDCFLGSTDRDPWRIKRILVEECVAKRFEKVIEWKASRSSAQGDGNSAAGSDGSARDDLNNRCSVAYSYGGKRILFGYVGNVPEVGAVVVDTYRTVKELLALLKTYRPFCLSLWSSDVSESHEIAMNTDANIIWINDFCNFNGPPQSSQSFFSVLDVSVNKITPLNPKNFTNMRDNWLSLDVAERVNRIQPVLKNMNGNILNFNLNNGSFFSATKNSVCFGEILPPVHVIYVESLLFNSIEQILFIVRGGCAMLKDPALYELLTKIGAPVNLCDPDDTNSDAQDIVYRSKVMWTSYGTIFAN